MIFLINIALVIVAIMLAAYFYSTVTAKCNTCTEGMDTATWSLKSSSSGDRGDPQWRPNMTDYVDYIVEYISELPDANRRNNILPLVSQVVTAVKGLCPPSL